MTPVSSRLDVGGDMAWNRGRARALLFALCLGLCVFLPTASMAHAEGGTAAPAQCDAGVNAEPSRPRYISLVIDDSGLMFAESGKPLDRWSAAKYSLEVFAVMLGQEDSLDVYRMSDFAQTAKAAPQLRLSGQEPASSRVAKVHAMQLVGGGTPYAPVLQAMRDLVSVDAVDKWLVVLSDGEFNDRKTPDVISDFKAFVKANSINDVSVRIAFMSIGEAAPRIPADMAAGIYSAHAAKSAEVLGLMTDFSNRIFQRSLLPQDAPNMVATDIDLEELLVFAQGQDVALGALTSTAGELEPDATVKVSWADNQDANFGSGTVPAVPNKELRGAFATYTEVSAGTWALELGGAKTVDVFYRPKVRFGVQLKDENGQVVSADRIVGGTYRLEYGFMNSKCEFITSPLLGEVTYRATVSHDGQVIAENFASGDQIQLDRGQVVLEIGATYLDGNTSQAKVGLQVLRPPVPAGFEATDRSYNVSSLADTTMPQDAMLIEYTHLDNGQQVPFTPEEWATLDESSFKVTTTSNLEFQLALGDEIGQILLLPRAPSGDVYKADVGDIQVHLEASHVYDEQVNTASSDLTVKVIDDLSWVDRLVNWLLTEGWKWLLALLGLILLCGYLFKPRFSRKIKPRPTVTFMPKALREQRREGKGKFNIAGGRRLLPFLADTATFTYVLPGAGGFRAMKLKARRGGSMQIVNWKQLAEKKNLQINGTQLDADAKRVPLLGVSSTVTASDAQGRYECTPNA